MLSNCFRRKKINIVKGKGELLWDSNGNEYIDFLSARSAANIGHCNDHVVEAVKKQVSQLIHYTNDMEMDIQDRYSRALEKFTPNDLNSIYFSNSGAETVEAAIKLARARTGKKNIYCLDGAFHGRTMGALSASYNEDIKRQFTPLVEGISHLAVDEKSILSVIASDPDIAAVMLEPVQGESGVHPVGIKLLEKIRAATKEKGVLLIFDEIQTGFGRCGGRFYCERINICPDILLASKSIASGFPLGMLATREELDFQPGEHGSTFSGQAVCCAAGLATLEYFESEKLYEKGEEIEAFLESELKPLASKEGIQSIRIIGAMVGIEIDNSVFDGTSIVDQGLEQGIVINFTGGNVIRIMPPLNIRQENLQKGVDILLRIFLDG